MEKHKAFIMESSTRQVDCMTCYKVLNKLYDYEILSHGSRYSVYYRAAGDNSASVYFSQNNKT